MRVPVISSNMDTVYSPELARAIVKAGGIACTHRFCTIEENVKQFKEGIVNGVKPIVSIGIREDEFERATALVEAGAEIILIDLANGACQGAVEQFNKVSKMFPSISLWVGNFATKEQLVSFLQKVESYPEVIKISIGSGAACLTRAVTGVGLPSVATIESLRDVCKELNIGMLFDGGINTPGDLAKAIALGCDAVMMGRHFAATYESAAPKIYLDELTGKEQTQEQLKNFLSNIYKDTSFEKSKKLIEEELKEIKPNKAVYRGSASIQSYKVQGKEAAWRAPEGEQMTVEINGSVADVVQKLEGGLRSAMTYCNCKNLTEFQNYGRLHQNYMEVTPNSYLESKAHGKFGNKI